jgi:hypothetical protein
MDFLKTLGISGGIAGGLGLLIGVVLVTFIRPTEGGGVAILVAIPTVICSVLGSVIGWFRKRTGTSNREDNNDKSEDNT